MMVALNFDISTIETSEFSPLNPGVYRGEIVSAEQKTSQSGNDYLSLQITVGDNRRVFDNLNLWHKTSDKAVEIGKERPRQTRDCPRDDKGRQPQPVDVDADGARAFLVLMRPVQGQTKG